MLRRRATWAMLVSALAVHPVAASDLVDFARCLSRAGATFYTADWCPHCARQTRMFGSAIRHVRVVNCTAGCRGIGSFPTWRFADGSQLKGVASFEALAARTGCRLGGSRDEARDDDAGLQSSIGTPTRERSVGGARIIEVPRR